MRTAITRVAAATRWWVFRVCARRTRISARETRTCARDLGVEVADVLHVVELVESVLEAGRRDDDVERADRILLVQGDKPAVEALLRLRVLTAQEVQALGLQAEKLRQLGESLPVEREVLLQRLELPADVPDRPLQRLDVGRDALDASSERVLARGGHVHLLLERCDALIDVLLAVAGVPRGGRGEQERQQEEGEGQSTGHGQTFVRRDSAPAHSWHLVLRLGGESSRSTGRLQGETGLAAGLERSMRCSLGRSAAGSGGGSEGRRDAIVGLEGGAGGGPERADLPRVVLVGDLAGAVVELELLERGERLVALLGQSQPLPLAGRRARQQVVVGATSGSRRNGQRDEDDGRQREAAQRGRAQTVTARAAAGACA